MQNVWSLHFALICQLRGNQPLGVFLFEWQKPLLRKVKVAFDIFDIAVVSLGSPHGNQERSSEGDTENAAGRYKEVWG